MVKYSANSVSSTNQTDSKDTRKKGKQIKVTLATADANFVTEIAAKLGITEAEVLRKGVKLMNLYADIYDKPDSKLVIETATTKQDILVL